MKFKMNSNVWKIKEISNEDMNKLTGGKEDCFTHGTTEYDSMTIYLNKKVLNKRATLYHELCHCYLYEYGHNQWNRKFEYEDVCEIVSTSHNIIHDIVEKYFKGE